MHSSDRRRRRQVVQVAHRRRELRVAELVADHSEGLPFHQELERHGVPQAVGMNALLDPGLPGPVFEHVADVARVHRLSARADVDAAEQRLAAGEPQLRAREAPAVDHRQGVGIDRHLPALPALAPEHGDCAHGPVDVLRIERQGLGDPQPRAPQQHHERSVAVTAGPLAEVAQQPFDLLAGQRLRRELHPIVQRALAFAIPGLHDRRTIARDRDGEHGQTSIALFFVRKMTARQPSASADRRQVYISCAPPGVGRRERGCVPGQRLPARTPPMTLKEWTVMTAGMMGKPSKLGDHTSQLRAFGISAEAFEDLVIIEVERPYMSLTPAELRGFYPYLNRAYQEALKCTSPS